MTAMKFIFPLSERLSSASSIDDRCFLQIEIYDRKIRVRRIRIFCEMEKFAERNYFSSDQLWSGRCSLGTGASQAIFTNTGKGGIVTPRIMNRNLTSLLFCCLALVSSQVFANNTNSNTAANIKNAAIPAAVSGNSTQVIAVRELHSADSVMVALRDAIWSDTRSRSVGEATSLRSRQETATSVSSPDQNSLSAIVVGLGIALISIFRRMNRNWNS